MPKVVVVEKAAHVGRSRGELSHENGEGIPDVLGGGLVILAVDTLYLRAGPRGVDCTDSVAGVGGCGASNWNRNVEAHVSTSYSKTCGGT